MAIEFAKALMADPAGISVDLRNRLRTQYSTEQITELALDVMKWSYQKVAVALGVDREVVPGELTDLVFDDAGNWVGPASGQKGKVPVRSWTLPNPATRRGYTPTALVPMTVMANAATIGDGGLIGAVLPSGTLIYMRSTLK